MKCSSLRNEFECRSIVLTVDICPMSLMRNTRNKGYIQVPECGLFHSTLPMEERKAPDPSERSPMREIDPTAYSLSSSSKLLDESFDETNEIKSWTGGNTDFSDLDVESEPIAKIETDSTDVELIHED